MKTFCCKACRGTRPINPRNPNQQYCNRVDCQRARKRAWQQKKRATDPQYRENQIDCQERWREQHPEYWQAYRKSKKFSPPPPDPSVAKMDGLPPYFFVIPGKCIRVSVPGKNIKMDAFQATIVPVPASCDPAKDDIIGKFAAFVYSLTKENGQVRTPPNCSP